MENTNNTAVENTATESVETTNTDTITIDSFTPEQMAFIKKYADSESDRRVNQAQKKWDKETAKKISLAQMDENERAKVEAADEIARLEAELNNLKLENNSKEVAAVLANHGIPAEFAECLNIPTEKEDIIPFANRVEKLINGIANGIVEKRIAGGYTPKRESSASSKPMTAKELFSKSPAEIMEFKNSNPEMYKQLARENGKI